MVNGRPRIYTTEVIEAEADLLEEWLKKEDNIYFKDFSLSRDYPSEYMSRWAKENEKFAHAYARAKDWQESKLFKGGLTRKYEPSITKLGLYHVNHWVDQLKNLPAETTESAIHPSANNTSGGLINDSTS